MYILLIITLILSCIVGCSNESNAESTRVETTIVGTWGQSNGCSAEIKTTLTKTSEKMEDGLPDGFSLPEGFVYLDEVIPDVIYDIKYSSEDNFTGKIVPGYHVNRVIITKSAALALKAADEEFKSHGYRIKVFDAYRPLSAGDCFTSWALAPEDNKTKHKYYPGIEKKDLFALGFIAFGNSSHSSGSTVDLTLVEASSGNKVDMGTHFDYFGEASRHDTSQISIDQRANRNFLRSIMEKHGFMAYEGEWWEYRLISEPFEGEYFDFPVR